MKKIITLIAVLGVSFCIINVILIVSFFNLLSLI